MAESSGCQFDERGTGQRQPTRQIQVRIIQIPPHTNHGHPSHLHYCVPDPTDLLLEDGELASSNILREALSLPTTVITRDVQLQQPEEVASCSSHQRAASESMSIQTEGTTSGRYAPESTCQCHVMRMTDNTILWFVVNEIPPLVIHEAAGGGRISAPDNCQSAHSVVSGPFCRICFMGAEEGPLIRVCHCRGTVGMVHHRCALIWTVQRQSYTCEICHYSYNLQVNGLRWCWQWIYPLPRGQIATQVLLFCMSWVVMVFSIASLIFITFNLRTLFPDDVTAGVFIVMNSFTLLCSVGILLTQSMYPIRSLCQRFCLANLDIEILPYQESDTVIHIRPLCQSGIPSSCVTDQTTNQGQPQSLSSPNLYCHVNQTPMRHLMSIPSVQLDEMVHSNQMVLGTLQPTESTGFQQTQGRASRARRTTGRRRRLRRFCTIS